MAYVEKCTAAERFDADWASRGTNMAGGGQRKMIKGTCYICGAEPGKTAMKNHWLKAHGGGDGQECRPTQD